MFSGLCIERNCPESLEKADPSKCLADEALRTKGGVRGEGCPDEIRRRKVLSMSLPLPLLLL
jgi:hypothetical protein